MGGIFYSSGCDPISSLGLGSFGLSSLTSFLRFSRRFSWALSGALSHSLLGRAAS